MARIALSALLGAGALTAFAISTAIMFFPGPFYASYGIDPSGNIALLNELKAPALLIMAAGVSLLAGLFRATWRTQALWTGLALYLGFGLSRLLAIILDGVPSTGLMWVMVSELALGVFFALALRQTRNQTD